MTHGYMLSGSGSNVYVQNLCRALVRKGHEVHLLCQEPRPLDYDFVSSHLTVDGDIIEEVSSRKTCYPGRCAVYSPEIGSLLPVYVYDDYPGWRVKTFLDLTDEELENYIDRNAAAVRTVLGASGVDAVVTNHSVPGPLISRRALEGTSIPYVSIVHGSCLQYVSRKSAAYMSLTREGLEGAKDIMALSDHSAGTIAEDFPGLANKTISLPGGVDTGLFNPETLDLHALEDLEGGTGRGPEQRSALEKLLGHPPENAGELADGLRAISASYDARSHDRDAGRRLRGFVEDSPPLVVYVGKLIHSKGVHSLLSAFAQVRHQTDARLLVVGFGTFREALEALTHALSEGDRHTAGLLAGSGRLFEGGEDSPIERFHLTDELFDEAEGVEGSVEFVGPLYHGDLAKLLPAADVAVVPSIFPETFGLVAAEFAASGTPPFVADHSGLREAGAIVGRGLPFDLRVGMESFEENISRALTDYLMLPREERDECRRLVRRNSVDYLGWDTLADRIVEIAGG